MFEPTKNTQNDVTIFTSEMPCQASTSTILKKKHYPKQFYFSLQNKLKTIDSIAALGTIVAIALAYYDNDQKFNNPDYSEEASFFLLLLVIVVDIILQILIYLHYSYILQINKLQMVVPESKSLFNSYLAKYYYLELFISALSTPPYYDLKFTVEYTSGTAEYRLSDIFLSIMSIRIYLVTRLYTHYSKWTSKNSKNKVSYYKIDKGLFFALRSDLKERLLIILGIILVVTLIGFGIPIKMLERAFVGPNMADGFEYFSNVMWMLVITMTTVGYGDYYPSTDIGRIVSMFACIIGNFLVSILVVWIFQTSEFSNEEGVAYNEFKMVNCREIMKVSAAQVVIVSLKMNKERDLLSLLKHSLDLRLKSHEFYLKYLYHRKLHVESLTLLQEIYIKLDTELFKLKFEFKERPKLESNIRSMQARGQNLASKLKKAIRDHRKIKKLLNYDE